jgi:hypothetical protein
VPILALASSGCKDDEFVFFRLPAQPAPPIQSSVPIREAVRESKVDILWVIDNSGSMSTFQREVIANTGVFMQEFVKDSLQWSMGLISTDPSDLPYIGFTPTTLLNYLTPNGVGLFQGAVGRLGVGGSGYEQTFAPIQKHLDAYPSFTRKDAYLAVISVTDAEEQSGMTSAEFLQYVAVKKGAPNRTIFYGALGADDLGCRLGEGWNYSGSKYEDVVLATGGRVFPICTTTFGKDLAALGNDLVRWVSRPMIRLSKRPKVSSVRVSFEGRLLPGGFKEDGGFWLYDFDANALVFHDMDFAPNNDDVVDVSYQEDDGLP